MDGLNRATVCFWKSTRSPTGREPHGDGDPIVVRGRESWPHGEAGQVDRNDKEPGRRDVKSRPPENPATGEPCAWKSCPHGSGRGGWKRARSRLAVTADANGRVNELRRKPSTSPAAYSTESQSPAVELHTRCYSVSSAAPPGADRSTFAIGHLRLAGRWRTTSLKGMSGRPKPR